MSGLHSCQNGYGSGCVTHGSWMGHREDQPLLIPPGKPSSARRAGGAKWLVMILSWLSHGGLEAGLIGRWREAAACRLSPSAIPLCVCHAMHVAGEGYQD